MNIAPGGVTIQNRCWQYHYGLVCHKGVVGVFGIQKRVWCQRSTHDLTLVFVSDVNNPLLDREGGGVMVCSCLGD